MASESLEDDFPSSQDAYTAQCSTAYPGCILILMDQSLSMGIAWRDGETKAAAAARTINTVLVVMISKSIRGDEIVDRAQIGIIAYGNERSGPAFILGSEDQLVPISKLDQVAVGLWTMDVRGRQSEVPKWVEEHTGSGGTPMAATFDLAYRAVQNWVNAHQDSPAPVIMHITDGESTDGDPTPNARKVMELRTNDGHALVFNCHITEKDVARIEFPANDGEISSLSNAQVMFRRSSPLPGPMGEAAWQQEFDIQPGARGCVYHADSDTLYRFMRFEFD